MLEITVVDEGSAPSAIISAEPASGEVPLTVEFDGSGSVDPDNDIIQYEWDFENDGTVDSTGDSATHTYNEVGDYEVSLTVTDSAGNENETTTEVSAGAQGIVAVLEIDITIFGTTPYYPPIELALRPYPVRANGANIVRPFPCPWVG